MSAGADFSRTCAGCEHLRTVPWPVKGSYCATPEDLICLRETLDEILAVLALCTDTQRERFLLYALHDFSYAEIADMCGCSKVAVHYSIEAVRKKFLKFWLNHFSCGIAER